MRRWVSVLMAGLVVAVLAGCAAGGGRMGDHGTMNDRVKCPACGYEFNRPSDA